MKVDSSEDFNDSIIAAQDDQNTCKRQIPFIVGSLTKIILIADCSFLLPCISFFFV